MKNLLICLAALNIGFRNQNHFLYYFVSKNIVRGTDYEPGDLSGVGDLCRFLLTKEIEIITVSLVIIMCELETFLVMLYVTKRKGTNSLNE